MPVIIPKIPGDPEDARRKPLQHLHDVAVCEKKSIAIGYILIMLAILLSACAKSGVQGGRPAQPPLITSPSMTSPSERTGSEHSGPKPGPSPRIRSAMNMAVLSECDMLKAAFRLTKRYSGRKVLSIVEGCPGYEDVPPVVDRALENRRFIKATNAFPPAHVEAEGEISVRVFRRMIARGVPVSVARKVTFLEVFKKTVQAQSHQGR